MIEKWITSLGDWNHAFIVLIGIWPVAVIFHLLGFSFEQSMFLSSTAWSFFYYGKEHRTYSYGGRTLLNSLNPFFWEAHDRNQTFYVVIVAYSIATAIKYLT